MRIIDYKENWQKLLSPDIVKQLTLIHEFKGEQLVELAKIQSTEASNRIEGIFTSEDRLKNLVLEKTTPASRNESEIAGYRDVLNTIHKNYDYIPVTANYILQLHKDLYKFGFAELIK